jgi:uncharacterized protein (TIGR00369 family)
MTSLDETAGPWWRAPGGDADSWLAWTRALPFCRDIGVDCVSIDEDEGVFTMPSSVLTPNPNGAVNGGLLAAAADQVMGAMAQRSIGHRRSPATASLHIQYHAPASTPLIFHTRVLSGGHRVRFVEVVVENHEGMRCATAQATMVAREVHEPDD